VPNSQCGGLGLHPGQSKWDSWWTKCHWGRCFFDCFSFPVSIIPPLLQICSYITLGLDMGTLAARFHTATAFGTITLLRRYCLICKCESAANSAIVLPAFLCFTFDLTPFYSVYSSVASGRHPLCLSRNFPCRLT
jgi:hypothetical protein